MRESERRVPPAKRMRTITTDHHGPRAPLLPTYTGSNTIVKVQIHLKVPVTTVDSTYTFLDLTVFNPNLTYVA